MSRYEIQGNPNQYIFTKVAYNKLPNSKQLKHMHKIALSLYKEHLELKL
jgi:hypothetical protein